MKVIAENYQALHTMNFIGLGTLESAQMLVEQSER